MTTLAKLKEFEQALSRLSPCSIYEFEADDARKLLALAEWAVAFKKSGALCQSVDDAKFCQGRGAVKQQCRKFNKGCRHRGLSRAIEALAGEPRG